MNLRKVNAWTLGTLLTLAGLGVGTVAAQTLAKAQVANLIGKVENGVDEFRDYLKKRGENASSAASSAQAQGRASKRANASPATKEAAKDELDDALSDLNRSTNRLRRKFDATDTWMETKVEVDRVMDDGRRINQVVARGKYGADAARLWGVLRSGMNDLARAYGLPPMTI
jgi:transcription initiation factor TFIIIB Brf1 subunit/transcription initiation factor TFIIB